MVQPWKFEEVKELTSYIEQYPVVGIVDLTGIPASQLQSMRASLRNELFIRVSKKNLMKRAIDNSKKENISDLSQYFRGIPGFIFSCENPFKLFKTLEAKKVPAPAKPGQIAPNDIVIPKGDTGLPPGPVIGELGKLGVKAKVEGGKIAVLEDKVVVKEGEEISADVVNLLNKLKIEPLEIGLNLLAVHEGNLIFTKKDLAVDETEILDNILLAHQWAFNLAINASIFTRETTELLISRAFREAISVATESVYVNKESASSVLGRAYYGAVGLASVIAEKNPEAVGDALDGLKISVPQDSDEPKAKEDKKGEDKEEKEEEVSADDAAAGLGALFG